VELAEMVTEGGESDSRESRTFRQWINSLGISGVTVSDLVSDCRTGVVLLEVMDRVEPGLVDWRRVHMNPPSRFKRVENGNYVVDLGRHMDFHLVNVGGLDIVDGNAKLVHGFVWQLMRHHTLKVLAQVAFDGFEADEASILAWANERVVASCGDPAVALASFKDPSLATSVYLLHLLSSVRSVVNWELVSGGTTPDEKAQNAKYLISVARKLGAAVFCTWEDIVEVKPKMILLLVASVVVVQNSLRGRSAASAGRGARRKAGRGARRGDDEDEDEDEDGDGGEGAGALVRRDTVSSRARRTSGDEWMNVDGAAASSGRARRTSWSVAGRTWIKSKP
jgi:plastin-1